MSHQCGCTTRQAYITYTSDKILELLAAVSAISPRHVSTTTLPLLFTSLPNNAPPRDAEPERIKYWTTLSFLKRLCIQADLFEMLVVRLSTKLDLICVPIGETQPDSTDKEPTAAYAHSLLRTLADALSKKVQLGHPDVTKYVDRLLPRLFNLHIYSVLVSNGDYLVATDPRLVSVSAEIVNLILQTASAQYVFQSRCSCAKGADSFLCTGSRDNSSRPCSRHILRASRRVSPRAITNSPTARSLHPSRYELTPGCCRR